ncbi:TDT family transporter [Streptomyces sp. A7024]|uniref:TDT family transporter n=1 Tax=Streptomyces coryli TaxID=1128680 RepID=A0A6G4TXW8_9ACTN|nr:TDT family transporter [Streptomyces coryli]NGN64296.1 TDT family transporter [Streptomyces coryli]
MIAPATAGPLTGHRLSVRNLGPNWYAAVMGTAIVATAGAAQRFQVPGLLLHAVWALSLLMLATILAGRAVHWTRHRDQARLHLLDPGVAPFYGCLSMALLAVGAATSAVGVDLLGEHAAVVLDAVLWIAGTVIGVVAAAAVPYLMVARHRIETGSASPVWLLPVVAPMVSAATGPAFVPHLPEGQWRLAMIMGCYAFFGISLFATLIILPVVFSRLLHGGPLPLTLTPTLFLVLGPLGQSTTALNNIAAAAPLGSPEYAGAAQAFAFLYGAPVMGFALLWFAFAAALVVGAVRDGMTFAMTWWGFTFPVGTCVTGAAGLARHTGLDALFWLSAALYAFLVAAWLIALVRTVRGVASGALLPYS